jgi:hypothetical protein
MLHTSRNTCRRRSSPEHVDARGAVLVQSGKLSPSAVLLPHDPKILTIRRSLSPNLSPVEGMLLYCAVCVRQLLQEVGFVNDLLQHWSARGAHLSPSESFRAIINLAAAAEGMAILQAVSLVGPPNCRGIVAGGAAAARWHYYL